MLPPVVNPLVPQATEHSLQGGEAVGTNPSKSPAAPALSPVPTSLQCASLEGVGQHGLLPAQHHAGTPKQAGLGLEPNSEDPSPGLLSAHHQDADPQQRGVGLDPSGKEPSLEQPTNKVPASSATLLHNLLTPTPEQSTPPENHLEAAASADPHSREPAARTNSTPNDQQAAPTPPLHASLATQTPEQRSPPGIDLEAGASVDPHPNELIHHASSATVEGQAVLDVPMPVQPRPQVMAVYTRRRPRPAAGGRTPANHTASPTAAAPQDQFISRITKAVGTLLPVPTINKRRPKSRPQGSPPRRSRRVAGLAAEPIQPLMRSKKTVMRSLGFGSAQERVQPDDQDKYAKLFSQPLSETHIRALAALFGWSVPEFSLGCGSPECAA